MKRLLFLFVAPVFCACNPVEGTPCTSGVREDFSASVAFPTGSVDVSTSQCVASAWTSAPCADGPELCEYFFEPHTPAEVPLELIFGDFVFRHAIGSLELSPPADTGTTADLRLALETIQTNRLAEDYRVSTVQPITLLDGNPAYKLTVACDHPDIDPICPFTTQYLLVDLDEVHAGMYADFTAVYADFVDAGNAAAGLPEEFADYDQMVASIELTVE